MKHDSVYVDVTQILLVEDDDDHAEIVIRALGSGYGDAIHRVRDGEAALDYLFRRKAYADPALSPRPRLILLDLRLPKVDGLEVLRIIKNSKDLPPIPVVILTSSKTGVDLTAAYKRHANSYLVKPVKFGVFVEMMNSLAFYWRTCNRLPLDEENQ